MHPALRISSLAALPSSVRRIAIAAATGPLDDRVIQTRLILDQVPRAQGALLLPVFYANLDPLGVPTAAEMAADATAHRVCTTSAMALLALRAIYPLQNIPLDAFPEVWERVWAWADFFDTYSDHLPWLDLPPNMCVRLVFFIGEFQWHKPARDIIATTEGFRTMLVRAWALLLRGTAPPELAALVYHIICNFIQDGMRPGDPANLAELIDGAGGSLDDLALLLVAFIEHILPSRDTVVTAAIAFYLDAAVGLMADAELQSMKKEMTSASYVITVLGPLVAALARHGVVRALTTMACALSHSSVCGRTLDKCLTILDRILTSGSSYRLLPEALESGLLIALVSAGKSDIGDQHNNLTPFITRTLSASLVHYHVLLWMGAALYEVQDLVQSHAFQVSKIFDKWQRFSALAHERLGLLESFNAKESVAYSACDNLQNSYYCSKECQACDWYSDGHRARGILDENSAISTRERAFLRFLLHHDYSTRTVEVHTGEVKFMKTYPNLPFFVLFDYYEGHVKVDVKPIGGAEASMGRELYAQWLDDAARAARSGGRMQVHLMRVLEGDHSRFCLVPLRTVCSTLRDGLAWIAADLRVPVDGDSPPPELADRVAALVACSVYLELLDLRNLSEYFETLGLNYALGGMERKIVGPSQALDPSQGESGATLGISTGVNTFFDVPINVVRRRREIGIVLRDAQNIAQDRDTFDAAPSFYPHQRETLIAGINAEYRDGHMSNMSNTVASTSKPVGSRSQGKYLARGRVSMACAACRKRKIKCTPREGFPKDPCARCLRRGLRCQYMHVSEQDGSIDLHGDSHGRSTFPWNERRANHAGAYRNTSPRPEAELHNDSHGHSFPSDDSRTGAYESPPHYPPLESPYPQHPGPGIHSHLSLPPVRRPSSTRLIRSSQRIAAPQPTPPIVLPSIFPVDLTQYAPGPSRYARTQAA
ncbi:hypothetical protein FB451DRAFT_1167403 [Mycena latifolia]|nr:hypothetical protein FB451DRAFT_1167403 [Mycena latifolia]